eukprot:COSAG04_NODE_2046_length_4929_cov_2.284679_3_plen_332_part_00
MVIEPLPGKCFGATISGVELGSLDDEGWAPIERAFLEHGLLVFPAQHLTEAQQIEVADRFSEHEQSPERSGRIEHTRSRGANANARLNEFWHVDSASSAISAGATLLSAVTLTPPGSGQTEIADLRAAYRALTPAMRRRVEGLNVHHSQVFGQANDLGHFPVGHSDYNSGDLFPADQAFLRPLVKRHPRSGQKSLMLGRHAFGLVDAASGQLLPRGESRELVADLMRLATSDDAAIYRHEWQTGELLAWDNLCTMHRREPWDYERFDRSMISTRNVGDPETERALNLADDGAGGGAVLARELEAIRREIEEHGLEARRSVRKVNGGADARL